MSNKSNTEERPFEYLRRKDTGEPFPEETVKNWYIARHYILKRLQDTYFVPGSAGHLHVVVEGDSPLMLAVVRQIALTAHYPNFVEYDPFDKLVCENRTVITLITGKSAEEIVQELEKEEYLCNLLKYCSYSLFGEARNGDSYLDIELEIVKNKPPQDADCVWITEKMVTSSIDDKTFQIDTRLAYYAGKSYELGNTVDNLPYEDIFSAERYLHALNTLQHRVLDGKTEGIIRPEWEGNLTKVKEALSNLFFADCFEARKIVFRKLIDAKQKKLKKNSLSEEEEQAIWEENHLAFSLSEHSRWAVEKLILGYRPLSAQEQFTYESYFGDQRTAYSKMLKRNAKDPAHINLCSFRDLRRIDPDNMKYDSFLMLALPLILKTVKKD